MDNLKPCPFCQSEARLVGAIRRFRRSHAPRGFYWHVGCSDPDCILYLDKNFKQARLIFATRNRGFAIRRWNRRAGEEE